MVDISELVHDYQSLVEDYEKENLTKKERIGLKKQITILGGAIEHLTGIKEGE